MTTRRAANRKPSLPPSGRLSVQLRRILREARDHDPLPPTRELGRRLGLAHTTVFRQLQQMAESGEIWQHPVSGRYYPAAARARLHRPKPVACLIRRLELASELYREILEGISQGCGEARRTMLFWHDELLVNHPDPVAPPVFASPGQQDAILTDFFARHGESAGGFVMDHIWNNEALRVHAERLQPAVVLFRSCSLPGFGNVRADFRAGALKALTHLLDRGFDRVVPLLPFAGDLAIEEFFGALTTAVDELGCQHRVAPPVTAGTDRQRTALITRLQRTRQRSALLCPEDNVAVLMQRTARGAGFACPARVGILSVMGTKVALNAEITCLHFDFRELGRLAVQSLAASPPGRHSLVPRLRLGGTT